jgi:3-oxoacyl-[acyl-carrier-protein] synthase-3
MTGSVGIVATACAFPPSTSAIAEVFADEAAELTDEVVGRLGIRSVHVTEGTSGSELAIAAAADALAAAGVPGKEIDVIVDYTILPQEYLVPVWNLGSRLQHELGATNAFALGFSGGGSTNFQVALRAAAGLLLGDGLRTALLFGADVAIRGNRVINPDHPVTVLGDGASAVVLAADADHDVVLGTELVSDGAFHDVCHIPGGALAQLADSSRADLYRLRIDTEKLARAPKADVLRTLGDRLLAQASVGVGDISHFVCPNVSAADQALYQTVWEAPPSEVHIENRQSHGHVQATDLVLNLQATSAKGQCEEGDLLLLSSHGMGFTSGVTLIRH